MAKSPGEGGGPTDLFRSDPVRNYTFSQREMANIGHMTFRLMRIATRPDNGIYRGLHCDVLSKDLASNPTK